LKGGGKWEPEGLGGEEGKSGRRAGRKERERGEESPQAIILHNLNTERTI